MLLQINKLKIFFYLFSFLLLTTITNNNFNLNFSKTFFIKNININTGEYEINKKISSKLNYLINKNIFLINKYEILMNLEEFNFLENIHIRKNYPSTLHIQAEKTDLIAITYIKQKKYFVGKNTKFILANKIENTKKLPIVFGEFEVLKLIKLNDQLMQQNLNIKKINKYFFHKNKRWDLYLEDNILIMLPHSNVIDALKLYNNFLKKNLIKNNIIIDLRINNRVILTNV